MMNNVALIIMERICIQQLTPFFPGVSALILVYKSKLLQTIIITDKRFLRHVNNSSQPIKKLEIFKLKQY